QTPLLLHIQSHRPALALTTAREALLADRCIDALLHIVSAVLHWDGLQNSATAGQQSSVLLAVLRVVAAHNMHVDAQAIGDMGAEQLVRCAFDHLLALAQVVATGVRATLLLRMLLAVRAFAPTCESPREVCGMPAAQRRETMDGRISHLAHRILSAEFADVDADDGKPELGFLITTHILRCPHSRLHLVHAYATETLAGHFNPQQQEATHEPQGVHARLTHSTFATYYAATMGALGETMEAAGVGNMAPHEALGFAARAADSWLALTKLTQTTPLSLQRPVLKAALRGSLRLIDLFVRHILPVLDAQLFAQRSQVLAVFSVVQKSTRILQNICNHSKVAKDVGLQASVPQVKRRLEQLVFQVVALMERNDCVGAINLGNLKHRDITGQVVGSQIPPSQRYSDTEDEQEEEEEEEEEDGLGLDTMLAREQEEEEEDERMPPVRRMRAARPPVPMTTAAAKKHALVVGRKRLLAHRREQRAREALRKHRRRSRDQDEEEEEAEDQDQDEDEEQEED
ncbi:Fanconi anemia group D2 protein, partial [Coemansia sp. RSA 2703]